MRRSHDGATPEDVEPTRLRDVPKLLVETVAWTFTAAGIALAVVVIGLRARRARSS